MKIGPEAAAIRRQRMLDDLAKVVELCNCLWPLMKLRNGDGHAENCPAHVSLGQREPT